jgi:hypothetical protein
VDHTDLPVQEAPLSLRLYAVDLRSPEVQCGSQTGLGIT